MKKRVRLGSTNGSSLNKELFADWLDLLRGDDELSRIAVIVPTDDSDEEKAEKIRKQLIALLLRHIHTAQLYHNRKSSDASARKIIDNILATAGRMIVADLALLKSHGLTYAMLISILNADSNKISEIKLNGDENLSFDELIIKYDLANGRYKAVEMALKKGRAE